MPSHRRKILPKEAFLSHSKKDRAFADKLLKLLRFHRVPVWYSPKSLVPAQKWHSEIGRALARCDWFIVVLSTNSGDYEWVARELVYALTHEQYRGHILPVLKERCNYEKLSWTLAGFQFVDFTKDFESGCRDLLRAWGLEHNRTVTSFRKRP